MTVLSASTLSAAVAEAFGPDVVKTANRKAKLLSLLPKRPGKGISKNWAVETTGSTPAIKSEGSQFNTGTSDTKLKATASYIQFTNSFGINDRAVKAAGSGIVPEEFIDLFGHELGNSVSAMLGDASTGINYYLFNGSGSGEPFGLEVICDTDETVFGIDQGSYATWQSNVVDSSGALTFADFQAAFAAVRADVGEDPDIIVCSPTSYRYIEKLYTAEKVLNMSVLDKDAGIGDLGWRGLAVNGVPVIYDKDCKDGYIYGINTETTYIEYLPQAPILNMREEVWVIPPYEDARSGFTSVPIAVSGLSVSGTAKSYGLVTDLALICENPASLFVIKNFTEPS